MRLILGIDPGSRNTGWCVVEANHQGVRPVAYGVFILKSDDFSERLCQLEQDLSECIQKYKPSEAAIEKIFLGKNADSAFKLGHARGVSLMCLAKQKISIYEYAARKVKQVITGSGAATKDQVQAWVIRDLKINEQKIALDSSDAMAIALCHFYESENNIKIQQLKGASL
jgi:crossover junction endodeoxyribonuclease RuvC